MADKAYSSAANRAWLRKRGITAVIPVKEDQKKHRRSQRFETRAPRVSRTVNTSCAAIQRDPSRTSDIRVINGRLAVGASRPDDSPMPALGLASCREMCGLPGASQRGRRNGSMRRV
jgi:hypothetical protein